MCLRRCVQVTVGILRYQKRAQDCPELELRVIPAMRFLRTESRSSARSANAIIRNSINASNCTHCIPENQFREAGGIKHFTYTICSCKFSLPISNFRNKFL